jgi:NodT family efflux transporter outer membrane factor (OMF) lipoprotein
MANRKRSWLVVLPSAALALGACVPTLAENPVRDARNNLPSAFGDPASTQEESVGSKDWRDYFSNADLQALVDESLRNNQELNVQLQELVIAGAEVAARRGEYLPRLGAGVGVGVDKPSAWSSRGASDRALGLPEVMGDFGFGLRASWEVDVWGRLRNAASAAERRALAAQEGRRFMVTQVVSELARSFYELVALDNAIAVVERNVDIQSSALEVVRAEKQAARVTELAVQRFEAELLKNRSRLFDLRQEVVRTENRINLLVGRPPQHVNRQPSALHQPLPAQLGAGIPSNLLENRPDIRQAQLQLEASRLDVAAARAAFFPALSLEAGLGYGAFNPVHLLATPESLLGNLAGNLVAPLLNRAGIEAQYRAANARQLQAVFTYERALLQAFTEVVNQLAQLENLGKSFALRAQQVEVLGRSVEVSNVLFQSARADYMEVLLTRRDSLEAELELIELKRQQRLATVDLYRALGGGWREPAAP